MIKNVVIFLLAANLAGVYFVLLRNIKTMKSMKAVAEALKDVTEELSKSIDVKGVSEAIKKDVMKQFYLLGYDRIRIIR